jgi:hypothetical protein
MHRGGRRRACCRAFVLVLLLQSGGPSPVDARDDPWKACCQTAIVDDQDPGPTLRRTLIDWQRQTLFTGEGHPGELVDSDQPPFLSWKKRQIAAAVTEFMKSHPAAGADGYFTSIGMACSAADGMSGVTRCQADVPIRIRCTIFVGMPEDRIEVPEPLRHLFRASLRVTVETSASPFVPSLQRLMRAFSVPVDPVRTAFIATRSQIVALPDGHLCAR